jgi:cytoskeletal protein RodZ
MQQQAAPVGNAQEPTPLLQTVRPEPPKTLYPLKAERTGLPFWAYAVAAVLLVAVLIWLLRPSSQPEKSAAPAKAVPAAQQRTLPPSEETNVAPPNVVQKPSPAQRESEAGTETKAPGEAPRADRATDARNGVNGDIWRVVVYTYDQEDAAKERAAQINKKDPQLNAAAFSPNGQSPFLVTVGGTMSRSDAKRFRDNAVRLGMPRDSYALNFTH